MVGHGKVERDASRLEADQENLHSGVGLKGLEDLKKSKEIQQNQKTKNCHA